MKDIVAEAAPNYASIYPGNVNPNLPPKADLNSGYGVSPREEKEGEQIHEDGIEEDKRAFSLARFIPLLSERVYVISPYTRMHLVSWLMVLDSVPDLELVAWLPEFLDGLLCVKSLPMHSMADVCRKYLADQNIDVRLATENVLAEFLREVKYIAQVQEKHAEIDRRRRGSRQVRRRGSKQTMESALTTDGGDSAIIDDDDDTDAEDEGRDEIIDGQGVDEHEWEGEGSGNWVPGQGVFVDHAAIMDIIIQHLSYPGELCI